MNDAAVNSPSYQLPDWLALEDAAARAVPTTFEPAALASLCQDVEVLLRLNPYYVFRQFRKMGDARYQLEFENKSNEQDLSVAITVTPGPKNGITIDYAAGLKRRTLFLIEPAPAHANTKGPRSLLVVVDDYGRYPAEERERRLAEVDKSLAAWAEALRVYFLRLRRWSWLPGWRWYIRRVWIPMKPSARRIVWLLYLISVVEFFFFLFVLIIYVIEQ